MLSGKLTSLRPVAASDLPSLREWAQNPRVMTFWGHPRPFVTEHQYDKDLTGRFIEFEREGHFMVLDPDSRPIGRIFYYDLDSRNRSVVLGIMIGEESAQAKGYGPDAIITLLRHLFLDRNVHRVELTVFVSNERAIKAYDRIGFVREGTIRKHQFVDGEYVDEYVMSILRPEFEERYR